MGNEWTCSPGEHYYQQLITGDHEPYRIFCQKCGWVRNLDRVEGEPQPPAARNIE